VAFFYWLNYACCFLCGRLLFVFRFCGDFWIWFFGLDFLEFLEIFCDGCVADCQGCVILEEFLKFDLIWMRYNVVGANRKFCKGEIFGFNFAGLF
jgi:hypothetical protein